MGASLLPGFQKDSIIGFFVTKISFQLSNIFDNFSFFSKKFPSKRTAPHLYKSDRNGTNAEWEARACHGLGSLRESGVALIVGCKFACP